MASQSLTMVLPHRLVRLFIHPSVHASSHPPRANSLALVRLTFRKFWEDNRVDGFARLQERVEYRDRTFVYI